MSSGENPIAQNYDLKTLQIQITSTVATLGIGVVPVGMKRYVTFVSLTNTQGGSNRAVLCSAANSANTSTITLASAAAKFTAQMVADENRQIPDGCAPEAGKPLFSIAAGAYMNALTSRGTADLFIQYYDM